MRTRIFCAGLVMAALLISARPAAAQFTYNFTEYVNETTNGTTIYATIAVDGPESMSFYPPGVVHIPYVFNQLSSNGTTVGGWQEGGGFCPNCYISFQNQQSITPQQGWMVDLEWSAYVDCTLAGIFWNGGGTIYLRIATTYWGPPPIQDENGDCHWANLACSSGTPSCTFVRGVQFVPGCPQYARSDTLVVGGSCVPDIAVMSSAGGPGPCN